MKRAVAYVGLPLAWLLLALCVGIAVSVPAEVVLHGEDEVLVLWRVVVLGLILPIVAGLVSVLVIRWARSVLGKPGGSRTGRIVLGIVVILWGLGTMSAAGQSSLSGARAGTLAGGAAMALFGLGLIVEAAWWHRPSRLAAAPMPEAPAARPESNGLPEIRLPEPPLGP
jgi:hypothetical protein